MLFETSTASFPHAIASTESQWSLSTLSPLRTKKRRSLFQQIRPADLSLGICAVIEPSPFFASSNDGQSFRLLHLSLTDHGLDLSPFQLSDSHSDSDKNASLNHLDHVHSQNTQLVCMWPVSRIEKHEKKSNEHLYSHRGKTSFSRPCPFLVLLVAYAILHVALFQF